MSDSVAGMKQFIDELKSLGEFKAEIEAKKSELSLMNKEYTQRMAEALKKMEVLEIEKQHIPGVGLFYCQVNESVKFPKEIDQKKAVFDYIKQKYGPDALMDMVSINSRSFNSFYKAEAEIAVNEQNSDWKMPGIEETKPWTELKFRKGQ